MKPQPRALRWPFCAALSLLAGCSALPQGYTQREWDALSAAERKREMQKLFEASDAMHRALAKDAATENGFIRDSKYGPW